MIDGAAVFSFILSNDFDMMISNVQSENNSFLNEIVPEEGDVVLLTSDEPAANGIPIA
ncbi:hypothetical protein ACM1RC_11650 [Paenibacillus azoreducens]|uniref:hypothetical protein n=1 Tax=Paenibacillus azoreducens TaxID=116718 RepID=UPI0039F46BFF